MSPLRRRIEQSQLLENLLARLVAGYVRLVGWTTHWTREGFDELERAVAEGPVILVMWHSRLVMAAAHLEGVAVFSALRDPSPAGRLAGTMQSRFGMRPIGMATGASNRAASRAILKQLKEGVSIGLTGDGPKGPALKANAAPVDWARVTGAPVFFYAFSTTRQKRLKSWDQLLWPKLFGRGHVQVARWDVELPRRADDAEREALRKRLETDLSANQAATDTALGLPPGP